MGTRNISSKDIKRALKKIEADGGRYEITRSGHIKVIYADGWAEFHGGTPKNPSQSAKTMLDRLRQHGSQAKAIR